MFPRSIRRRSILVLGLITTMLAMLLGACGDTATAVPAATTSAPTAATSTTAASATTAAGTATTASSAATTAAGAVTSATAATSGTTAAPTATLTIANNSGPQSLDPAIAGQIDLNFLQPTYASLLKPDKDGKLVGELATDWKYVGEGNKKFQVTIRQGVKFADGTPVTAKAVADSLNYFSQHGTGPSAGTMKTITTTVIDDKTVELNNSVPNNSLPDFLSTRFLAGMIISPAGLADPTKLKSQSAGAGQYIIDTANTLANDHYTFVPNPNYFDQSQIHWKQIVVKIIPNITSAVQAIQQGQVDVVTGDPTTLNTAKSAGLNIVQTSNAWVGIFLLDIDGKVTPALKDVKVRQALNYAIDRNQIAKALYGDLASSIMQPNTPGQDAFDPSLENTYAYDVNKAKQLLAEAGFADGFSFDVVHLTPDTQTTKMLQAVAGQLSQIKVQMKLVESTDVAALVTNFQSLKYASFSLAWGGQSQFANTNQVWLKNSPVNPFHYEVTGLQDAFDKYVAAPQDQRVAAAQAVTKIIVDQALTIPVVKISGLTYVSKKVTGVVPIPGFDLTYPTDWTPAS